MNTAKIYHDSEGNECSIMQVVRREPYWAANRLQEGEKAIDELEKLKSGLLRLKQEWIAHEQFLNNPHDDVADKSAGITYKECADILKIRFGI